VQQSSGLEVVHFFAWYDNPCPTHMHTNEVLKFECFLKKTNNFEYKFIFLCDSVVIFFYLSLSLSLSD